MREALRRHVVALASDLSARLGDRLVAVWAGGSLALDDVQATSDLDVAVVVSDRLDPADRELVADALLAAAGAVPARGLEAVVYARDDLADPAAGRYQVNVNGGPGMPTHVGGPGDDPSFWFVVDLAILRSAGFAVAGPAPAELIAEPPEHAIREALLRSLRWHREHGERPAHEVLNACRAWHHVATGGWASKSAAAAWAARRLEGAEREVVLAAADARAGRASEALASAAVSALSARVQAHIAPPTSSGR